MGRKVQRVRYTLDTKGLMHLPQEEIAAILRGADDLIRSGGRSLLVKVLKGSRAKKVLELGLDKSPVYGYYAPLTMDQILARVDWTIVNGYLDIEYDYRLPLLCYTDRGWEIERETYAGELLHEFDEMLESGCEQFDMNYLKDRARDMILLLLDKVEATRDKKYIPILEAWAEIDYKKVRKRIRQVVDTLSQGAA
ncbi:MAG: RQC domain protein [Anaerolineae bacterium]|nr:RQC domain protein [Anaerolineae bacterium]